MSAYLFFYISNVLKNFKLRFYNYCIKLRTVSFGFNKSVGIESSLRNSDCCCIVKKQFLTRKNVKVALIITKLGHDLTVNLQCIQLWALALFFLEYTCCI